LSTQTLTGTASGAIETTAPGAVKGQKAKAAEVNSAIQVLLNNDAEIKARLEGPIMEEGEDITLLGSSSAPAAGYVPTSDGAGGIVWSLGEPVIQGADVGGFEMGVEDSPSVFVAGIILL